MYETISKICRISLGIFTCITIPVYCFVLYLIWKYRKAQLKSSFFLLNFSLGFADLWLTFHKYAFHHGFKIFLYDQIRYSILVPTLYNSGLWGIFYVQILGVLFISINRFCALVYPCMYDAIWSKRVVKNAICSHWLLPIPLSISMLLPWCHSHYIGDELEEEIINKSVRSVYWFLDVCFESCVLLTLLVLYSVMFYKVRRHRLQVEAMFFAKSLERQASRSSLKEKTELRLAFMGFILSGLYFIMVVTFVCWALGYNFGFLDFIFYCASDLFTGLNPHLLLLFSKNVRSCAKIELKKLKLKLFKTVQVAPVIPTNNNNNNNQNEIHVSEF